MVQIFDAKSIMSYIGIAFDKPYIYQVHLMQILKANSRLETNVDTLIDNIFFALERLLKKEINSQLIGFFSGLSEFFEDLLTVNGFKIYFKLLKNLVNMLT